MGCKSCDEQAKEARFWNEIVRDIELLYGAAVNYGQINLVSSISKKVMEKKPAYSLHLERMRQMAEARLDKSRENFNAEEKRIRAKVDIVTLS